MTTKYRHGEVWVETQNPFSHKQLRDPRRYKILDVKKEHGVEWVRVRSFGLTSAGRLKPARWILTSELVCFRREPGYGGAR